MTKRNSTGIKPFNQVKRTVCGVGYNSGGSHLSYIEGKPSREYSIWREMISRCYSKKTKERLPTYKDCVTCLEWHDFQNFAEWYKKHPYFNKGYALDKDLLVRGNKVYSPETCLLIPRELNMLIISGGKDRNEYPRGVSLESSTNKFFVTISINGKSKNLGRYNCQYEAGLVYLEARKKYIKEKACEWRSRIDNRSYEALLNWVDAI